MEISERHFSVPYLPRGDGLPIEHFQSIAGDSPPFLSLFAEKGQFRIIDQVEQQMTGSQHLVWYIRSNILIWEGADRRAIDNEQMLFHHQRRQLVVSQSSMLARAGHITEPDAQLAQHISHRH